MNIMQIAHDCFRIVCEFLDDKSFINLISCNKTLNLKTYFKKLTNPYKLFEILEVKHNFIFTHIIYDQLKLFPNKIPESVTHITFCDRYLGQLNKIPKNATHVILGNKYKRIIRNISPTVEYLKLGDSHTSALQISPKKTNLKYIEFGNNFNNTVDNLPNMLIKLKFGNSFNMCVDNLPQKLKKIIFGNNFNQEVKHLPNLLEEVKFGYYFNQSINDLPKNIKKLH